MRIDIYVFGISNKYFWLLSVSDSPNHTFVVISMVDIFSAVIYEQSLLPRQAQIKINEYNIE